MMSGLTKPGILEQNHWGIYEVLAWTMGWNNWHWANILSIIFINYFGCKPSRFHGGRMVISGPNLGKIASSFKAMPIYIKAIFQCKTLKNEFE